MVRDDTDVYKRPGSTLDLRILGPLEAWRGAERLALGGRSQRSVLVCLLLEPGKDVSTDRIVDAVWGERPPSGVLSTLHSYVFHLREALEPSRGKGASPSVLVTVPGGYRLESAAVRVDAARFEDLVAAGRSMLASDPAAAASLLGQALGLWRGDVLADLVSRYRFVGPVAARLAELRVVAAEQWVEAELTLGREEVLGPLDHLVARYPLREHLAALRMQALYRAGRQAEALAAYRGLRHTLDEELGITPSAEVEAMHRRMLEQDPSLDLAAAATTAALASPSQPPPPPVAPGGPVPPTEPAASSAGMETGRRLRRGLIPRGRSAISAVLVVAVAAAVGWVLVRQAEVTPLPANSVGVLDAGGLRGEAVVLENAPTAMVSGGGAIWAVLGDADAMVRIDPGDRRVTQTVRGLGRGPQALAVLGEDLWVVALGEKVVTRVDMRTAQAGHQIPVGIDPVAVAAGPSGVWVANSGDNTVVRIDPSTERVDAPVFVGDGPAALALDGTTLWVANGRSGTVSQIDTRTGERAAADIRVDAGPAALAVTATDVWVANEAGLSVSRISRSTGRVQRIEVDDGPSSVLMVGDQVWVTNRYGGTVSRIDAGTNDVSPIDLRSAVSLVTEVDGQVWAGAGGFANADEHRGGTLVWEGTTMAPTADPASGNLVFNQVLLRSAFDSLVGFRIGSGRSPLGLVPDLATELPEPSDGGRTYVFTIRSGIRYSTGAEVTASDFVRGMQRALQPTASNPELLRAVVGAAECLDSGTPGTACDLSRGVTADDATGRLTIHLAQPDPELLEKLAPLLFPGPAGTPMGDLEWAPLPATGPYTVTAAGPEGVTLSRNPYFRAWSVAAQPDGYPDVIAYRSVGSDALAVDHVLGGTAAVAFPQAPLPLALTSRPGYLREFDLLDVQMVYPNPTVPPFDDKRVRQALNYAVDRNVARALEGGPSEYARPTCQLIPPGISGHRPYCPYQKGPADGPYQGPDLERARALVAESGTVGIPIVIHSQRIPGIMVRAEYTASVLRDLGYRVTVETEPPDPPRSVTDKYQIRSGLGWLPDYPLPGTYFDSQVGCGAPTYTPYCNRIIQALADQARSLRRTDPAKSLALWAQVDRMLTDDAALVPLVNHVATVAVSPQVGNVINRAGFGPLLHQMWVR